jgi:hypothetical protein
MSHKESGSTGLSLPLPRRHLLFVGPALVPGRRKVGILIIGGDGEYLLSTSTKSEYSDTDLSSPKEPFEGRH